MKITKSRLKEIIKEEIDVVLAENETPNLEDAQRAVQQAASFGYEVALYKYLKDNGHDVQRVFDKLKKAPRGYGKRIKIAIRKISLTKKGATPLKLSIKGIFFANLLIKKTFNPIGGVIKPTSTATSVRMPNHIAVSSALMPKFNSIKIGKNMGIVNKIIARLSIMQPNTKYKIKIIIKIKKGDISF